MRLDVFPHILPQPYFDRMLEDQSPAAAYEPATRRAIDEGNARRLLRLATLVPAGGRPA